MMQLTKTIALTAALATAVNAEGLRGRSVGGGGV